MKTHYKHILCLVPVQTTAFVSSETATSITISLSVGTGSVVTSYEVMWETDVGGCSGGSDMDSTTITDSTSYTITELEEDSTYSITVTASNSAGSSAVSNTVIAMTMEAGER